MSYPTSSPKCLFIDGSAGQLFTIYFPATTDADPTDCVVIVPPFAEEMMRTRRLVSMQARNLASQGIATLILDLNGTGDSSGRFRDARWRTWVDDLAAASHWLNQQGHSAVHLLGIRLGAILALDYQRQVEPSGISKTVLLQPVVSGRDNLREFLLLRVLAGMMQKAVPRVTLEALNDTLEQGGMVDIVGYQLSGDLWRDINEVTIDSLVESSSGSIKCIEVGSSENDTAASPVLEIVDSWRARGVDATLRQLSGAPFWSEWGVLNSRELLAAVSESFRA